MNILDTIEESLSSLQPKTNLNNDVIEFFNLKQAPLGNVITVSIADIEHCCQRDDICLRSYELNSNDIESGGWIEYEQNSIRGCVVEIILPETESVKLNIADKILTRIRTVLGNDIVCAVSESERIDKCKVKLLITHE